MQSTSSRFIHLFKPIVPFTHRSPERSLSLRFPTKILCVFLISRMDLIVTHLIPDLMYVTMGLFVKYQIMKPLVMQFSLPPVTDLTQNNLHGAAFLSHPIACLHVHTVYMRL
jgi:hypothetical protein